MIGKLAGILDGVGEDHALIDVNGVGYVVFCSAKALRALPSLGETVTFYVETHVREDAIKLFGFSDWLEKQWFVHLQGVQGVGARVALAIVDALSSSDLQQAVALQDKSAFARASGVGPKLAARIVTELRDRKPPAPQINAASQTNAYTSPSSEIASSAERADGLADIVLRNDAISALVNLGYSEISAGQAVAGAYAQFDQDPSLDVLIKAALQEISP